MALRWDSAGAGSGDGCVGPGRGRGDGVVLKKGGWGGLALTIGEEGLLQQKGRTKAAEKTEWWGEDLTLSEGVGVREGCSTGKVWHSWRWAFQVLVIDKMSRY